MRPDTCHPSGEPLRPEGQQTVLLRGILGQGGVPRGLATPPHRTGIFVARGGGAQEGGDRMGWGLAREGASWLGVPYRGGVPRGQWGLIIGAWGPVVVSKGSLGQSQLRRNTS